MARLSSADLIALNLATLALHSTQNAEEFSLQISVAVRALIASEIVLVDWIDPRTSVSLVCQYFPAKVVSEEVNALAHVLLPHQMPGWLQRFDEPRSVADFVSRNEWMRRDIFWAMQETVSQEDCLCLDVQLSSSLVIAVGSTRSRFGTYRAEESLKLKLLGPHMKQVYCRLLAQGKTAFAGRPRQQLLVVAIGREDGKCEWTDDARKVLRRYGVVVANDLLPDDLNEWFIAQKRALENPTDPADGISPFVIQRSARKLIFSVTKSHEVPGYRMVIQERDAVDDPYISLRGFGLSPRENEVLSWVARGKSNAEIAIILGISPSTAGRHLENIFPKLGVENRYAAGLLVNAALEAERRAKALG